MIRRKRWAAATVVAIVLGGIVLGTGAAGASPVGNDTQAGAVEASPLPFTYEEDTTGATVDAGEAVAHDGCLALGAPAFEHAVWFKLTVPDGFTSSIRADVTSSDYGVGIAVLADFGGGLSLISCTPGVFVSPGAPPAGTYYAVAFGDGTTAATGGTLRVTVDTPPPPPQLSLTIDKTATATKEGGVWITGKVTCTGGGSSAQVFDVFGQVTQTTGRLIISSFFDSSSPIPCDGIAHPWSGYVPPGNGKFAGGKAATVSLATGCGDGGCSDAYAEATVKVNRAHR